MILSYNANLGRMDFSEGTGYWQNSNCVREITLHPKRMVAWVQFKWLEWCRRWLDSYDPLRRSPAELYEHLASTNDYTSIDEWAGVT
jgi:hypothetical protein